MNHMTRDKIYHLATLVTQELAFDESDVSDMTHIGECDECYKKLRLAMALMEAVDNIGPISLAAKQKTVVSVVEERVKAVIHLVVGKVNSLLEQFDARSSVWTFDAPLAMAGARSVDDEDSLKKLEDVENSQTFVAYDPTTKLLALQIDCSDGAAVPKVVIRMADGTERHVSFVKREHLLWAEVSNLDEGEYDIVIEK